MPEFREKTTAGIRGKLAGQNCQNSGNMAGIRGESAGILRKSAGILGHLIGILLGLSRSVSICLDLWKSEETVRKSGEMAGNLGKWPEIRENGLEIYENDSEIQEKWAGNPGKWFGNPGKWQEIWEIAWES